MRRSQHGEQSTFDRSNVTALTRRYELRWDPAAYKPSEFYGEIAELFAKLRSGLGPTFDQYVRELKQFVKLSSSIYELLRRVEKLLSHDLISVHDEFVQVLCETCQLAPVSSSLEGFISDDVTREAKRGYVPHISTINALLILQSLEMNWAAPDPEAGRIISEAVRTMLADRIDAAVHVRKVPKINDIGFRSEFFQPTQDSLKQKYSMHQITTADLFKSFQVGSHFLGAETNNLLRLKCHANFYQKLKSSVLLAKDERNNSGAMLERSCANPSRDTLAHQQEAVLIESFSNISCVTACANISLPTITNISVFSYPIRAPQSASLSGSRAKMINVSAQKFNSAMITSYSHHDATATACHSNIRQSEIVELHSSDDSESDVEILSEAEFDPEEALKRKAVRRKRMRIPENISTISSDSISAVRAPRKSAKLDLRDCLPSGWETSALYNPSASAKNLHSFVETSSPPTSEKQHVEISQQIRVYEIDGSSDEANTDEDVPKAFSRSRVEDHIPKESRKIRDDNFLFSEQATTKSQGHRTAHPVKSGGKAMSREKLEIQKAQAIIEAWKSSSYEVLPSEPDLFPAVHEIVSLKLKRSSIKSMEPSMSSGIKRKDSSKLVVGDSSEVLESRESATQSFAASSRSCLHPTNNMDAKISDAITESQSAITVEAQVVQQSGQGKINLDGHAGDLHHGTAPSNKDLIAAQVDDSSVNHTSERKKVPLNSSERQMSTSNVLLPAKDRRFKVPSSIVGRAESRVGMAADSMLDSGAIRNSDSPVSSPERVKSASRSVRTYVDNSSSEANEAVIVQSARGRSLNETLHDALPPCKGRVHESSRQGHHEASSPETPLFEAQKVARGRSSRSSRLCKSFSHNFSSSDAREDLSESSTHCLPSKVSSPDTSLLSQIHRGTQKSAARGSRSHKASDCLSSSEALEVGRRSSRQMRHHNTSLPTALSSRTKKNFAKNFSRRRRYASESQETTTESTQEGWSREGFPANIPTSAALEKTKLPQPRKSGSINNQSSNAIINTTSKGEQRLGTMQSNDENQKQDLLEVKSKQTERNEPKFENIREASVTSANSPEVVVNERKSRNPRPSLGEPGTSKTPSRMSMEADATTPAREVDLCSGKIRHLRSSSKVIGEIVQAGKTAPTKRVSYRRKDCDSATSEISKSRPHKLKKRTKGNG